MSRRLHGVLPSALALLLLASAVSARPTPRQCRQQCAAIINQGCPGLAGRPLRKCRKALRKAVLKLCRQQGLGVCAPPTTTTLPVVAFTCPTNPQAGCNGGTEVSFASDPWSLVEPPPGLMPPLTHQWMTGAPSCATHSQVGYVVDAATGALFRPTTFDHPGGTTSVTAHVTFASGPAMPWIVTVEADDSGPPGYAGGKTATVYPVLCFY
jgi:hypothetical protein